MGFEKRGRIFEPPAGVPFVKSHAALAVADALGPDRHRVYFSGRDERQRARIAFFDIDLVDPSRILGLSERPVLDLGPTGAFDDSGVTTSCLVSHRSRKYLYYTGWSLGVTVPFYLFIGLAMSEDGGESFHRVSPAPVLPRSVVDPFLTASPWVLVEDGKWRMWYVTGSAWRGEGSAAHHYYHIAYAESGDGIEWRREGHICVTYASEDEHAFARPCVIRDADRYRMWYAYRGARYRLGYAESQDGLTWERQDARAGLETSETGWDSEMVCYPHVFDHRGRRFMLYNGNGYGRTGIGLAVQG